MDEIRLALRRLVKRPAATTASVLTLAVSIAAGAATWSLLSALLMNPLPVRHSERLVVLGTPHPRMPGLLYESFIYPVYPEIRDSGVFERTAAAWSAMPVLIGTGADRRTARAAFGTHDLLATLGVPVPVGRDFTPADDRRGAPPVVLLADRYWRQAFAGSRDVIGKTITIADKAVTIVGVAALRYRGLELAPAADMFLPFHVIDQIGFPTVNYFADPSHGSSPTSGVSIIGRLREGETAAQATTRIAALPSTPSLRGVREIGFTPIQTAAVPLQVRAGMRQFGQLLAATIALMLLIGCTTVGMLLLVRTEGRREELAMCLALGASRARLARGIVFEGALLALGGALLSAPFAWWLFKGLATFQLPGGITIDRLELSLEPSVVAAVSAVAFSATLLIAGAAGAFVLSAQEGDALRSRAGATPRVSRRKTRAVLVSAQVAVALVLVAGAGLFARSLQEALRLNPSIDGGRLLTGSLSLGPFGYSQARAQSFFDELRGRLTGNPAIGTLALSESQGGFAARGKLTIDGVPREITSFTAFTAVDLSYFRTVGLPVVQGRSFTAADSAQAPLVAIVSESFARFIGSGGRSALGARLTMPYSRPPAPPPVVEVVGVVPDVIVNVAALEPMVLYLPLEQSQLGPSRTIVIRAAGDVNAARREMSTAIRDLDPALGTIALMTFEERLLRQMGPQQFGRAVLATLGAIAVLLTVLGTYVLAESMAVLRMREMGVRAAVGATRGQLAAIVLRETARLIGFGLAIGLGFAWAGAGVIRGFLFRVQPLDPMTLAAVAGVILLLAMAVSLRPALRAARVDVAQVLRQE